MSKDRFTTRAFAGAFTRSLPRQAARSLPREAALSAPREAARSLPRQAARSLPREAARSLPREAARSLPREAARSLPRRPRFAAGAFTRKSLRAAATLCAIAATPAACALAAPVGAAAAAAPVKVTVRVVGRGPAYQQLQPPQTVTLTSASITKDGGSCEGVTAAGALQLATKGDWSGKWNSGFGDWEVTSIDGTNLPFEAGSPDNWYWGFLINGKEASAGVCGTKLTNGDAVLFLQSCYGKACPAPPAIGPGAIVATAKGIRNGARYAASQAPRTLAGKITSHLPVSSVAISLIRRHGGRCWSLRRSGKLAHRCGASAPFDVSLHGGSFAYHLPGRLPAGHYVFEIVAVDVVGDQSALKPGSSRIAFDVG